MAEEKAVFVETAARLHFGVLDLRGSVGRWFGGLGAAAPAPLLVVSAEPHETVVAEGADAERAAGFAARYLSYYGVGGGARITIHHALPSHSGLGSGTQLALSIARALAELHGHSTDVRELAQAVGRARRSAVGTWTFADGGFVVEGGRQRESDRCGPLVARLPFPREWRCVVAIPDVVEPTLSGAAEDAVFAALPPPSEREVEKVAHLVLMLMLPALADADLSSFGRALNEVQQITGQWFASVQGGPFARGVSADLIARMADWGAPGVGQSSWGPAIYAIVAGDEASRYLAEKARGFLGSRGCVFEGPFRAQGARVWRAGSGIA
jgi:beta-ribofuranosylaminobenzene 5'-phosphate synthase